MHEDGPRIANSHGFQHAVDMAARARAALHGKTKGLVENQHMLVLK